MATESMCGLKRCSHCGRVLPITMFAKSSKNKDGLQNVCNPCKSEMNRIYAKKRRDEREERMRLNKKALATAPEGTMAVKTEDGRTLRRVSPECRPLSEYKAVELLAELKARGYVWEKMYVKQYVEFSKI